MRNQDATKTPAANARQTKSNNAVATPSINDGARELAATYPANGEIRKHGQMTKLLATDKGLGKLLALIRALLMLLSAREGEGQTRRVRRHRKWRLQIGKRTATAKQPKLDQAEADRLLQRHRDLKDVDALAALAGSFRMPESDFYAERHRVEKLMRQLLERDAPWLRVGQVLAGGGSSGTGGGQEVVWREQEVREWQEVTLFVPDETWRDKPLASLTMRPARSLNDVWQARMLDQILPPEVLVDRCSRGEILIPIRHKVRQRLEFQAETRPMEIVTTKTVPIPIESEGVAGAGGQLLYILLDYSASMRGRHAVMALAVIAATVRANMGQRNTRYLFRRYAEVNQIWPRHVEPPLTAQTVTEKDAFLATIFETNFNGGATHVNDAIDLAVSDIETLRREENLDASMLLVTDGRAEILESTRLRLLRANVKVHTVMVSPEPNPGLQAISESFTALETDLESTKDAKGREEQEGLLPQVSRIGAKTV